MTKYYPEIILIGKKFSPKNYANVSCKFRDDQ